MVAWTVAVEHSATEQIAQLVAPATTPAERNRIWKQFLVLISPSLEAWSARHPLLRRCGLTGEDEPRAILLAVIHRLAAREFENLRRFRASVPPIRDDAEPLLEHLAQLAALDDDDPSVGTPLRAWLLTLVGFAVKDHVRQRLGWRSTSRSELAITRGDKPSTTRVLAGAVRGIDGVLVAEVDRDARAITVEHTHTALPLVLQTIADHGWIATPPITPDKRAVGSGAEPLDAISEIGVRPGMTDQLTLIKLLAEIREHAAGFPNAMRDALALWMEDIPYPEIASRVGVADADAARALVRAAHARLRERFRDDWPSWFER